MWQSLARVRSRAGHLMHARASTCAYSLGQTLHVAANRKLLLPDCLSLTPEASSDGLLASSCIQVW